VQAGTLTAGDYDDVLNFSLYQNYINDYLQTASASVAVPYVDISHKIPIKILDASGAPAKGAQVVVRANDAILASLRAPADGVVNIFPSFDQLPASFQIDVTPPQGGAAISTTVVREQLTSGRPTLITLPNIIAANTNIDVTLVLDTTNSMADEIKYLQAELTQVFKDIATDYAGASIRAGLVAYRDKDDIYVHKEFPFTDDLTRFNTDLASLFAGGGDAPEAMDQGLNAGLELQWRENSTKIMILVADAPPHNYEIAATWSAALKAREKQIHIVPIGASGVGKRAEFLLRSMAALTHSRYIFLTDDSGVGNPHDEPSVDCYVVTRLDASIRRVLGSLIKGSREEPTAEDIIRTQGNYQQGVCAPPAPAITPALPATAE
jgi:hypothetical protein